MILRTTSKSRDLVRFQASRLWQRLTLAKACDDVKTVSAGASVSARTARSTAVASNPLRPLKGPQHYKVRAYGHCTAVSTFRD
jgi:hypothetical protein